MIVASERYGKDNPYWLLTATHASDLYEKSTRSFDLIDLLESASTPKIFFLTDLDPFFKSLKSF